jgi:hypothetical protein
VVAAGLLVMAGTLWLLSTVQLSDGYGRVAATLALLGTGMGLTMAPATESIMGSLPLAKAGVGSAMNDTTRQVGGALAWPCSAASSRPATARPSSPPSGWAGSPRLRFNHPLTQNGGSR